MPTPPVPILLWEKRLRNKPCDPIKEFNGSLHDLVDKLRSTCYASNGAGLAAPQIGEFVRVAIIHFPSEKEAWPIINPVIDEINSKGEQVGAEGCLSIPQCSSTGQDMAVRAHVRRAQEIYYSYQDLTGRRIEDKATGFLARAIQHEVDHLSGIFFIDRIGDVTKSMVMRNFQNFLRLRANGNR